MKQISFHYFSREYAQLKSELMQACDSFFAMGDYVCGPQLKAFESQFAKAVGARYGCGVANGTDAITLAIKALDIPPGSEIITSAVSAYATVVGIIQAGCVPVLVDVDPRTGLIDTEKILPSITSNTRVLLPVHLYGQMVDMQKIMQIAVSSNLKVIEDCAQAYGATLMGKKAGSWGDAAAFSLYPTKNLGAYGDGGVVVSSDAGVATKLRALRSYGQTSRYHHDSWGINSRLDELHAALLNVKMRYVDEWIHARATLAHRYRAEIKIGAPLALTPDSTHTYHLYVITHPKRNQLQKYLESKGIATLIHYPVPQHRQKAFTYPTGPLPEAEKFCDSILSLPMSGQMTKDEVDSVIEVVNMFEG